MANSPNFWGKEIFSIKSSCHTQLHKGFEHDAKNTWTDGARWKDKKTLFHKTLSATIEGPTSTTAVDWHLKVKDIEHNVSLTKNYCITVSMQKISSIHQLILTIQ